MKAERIRPSLICGVVCGWVSVSALLACGKSASDGPKDPAVEGSGSTSSNGSGGRGGSTDGSGGRADTTGSGGDSGGAAEGGSPSETPPDSLSARYPGDDGIAADPAVLFFDDFEGGWGQWGYPSEDTAHLHIENESTKAHSGSRYLRSTVTEDDLSAEEYISSSTSVDLKERVDTVFWRFYAQFKGISPTPHHWVRMAAGDADFSASGLANAVPAGDNGFWFDFDANNDDVFNFYAYWHLMRSGRCNDGSVVPGCAGDQGTTYYYGNIFAPPEQTPFPRDEWFCIEIMGQTNSVGASDGALAFWINDEPVGDYRPGNPVGTWLRETFHTGGCTFSACTEPMPFEGFDFRTSEEVRFKTIFLDAYYERDTTARKRSELEAKGLTVSAEQTVFYDDVVVAKERIGCRVAP